MTKTELTSPWFSYYPFDDILFIPRTSRVRLAANPVQETRYSAKCIHKGQPCVDLHWSDGHIVTDDEIDEMTCVDLEMLRRETYGEWMKRVVAKVRHLKLTASGKVPFAWIAIGERFKYCGSWGTKRTQNCAEQAHYGVMTDFEPDDMVWRPEA
jgi:hypothetical protein